MDCDDFTIQVDVHKGKTEINALGQAWSGTAWIERPLSALELFKVSRLGHEVLLAAVRDLCVSIDACDVLCEMDQHPGKIPEGTYLLNACDVFVLEEAILLAWDSDVAELLREEPKLTGFPRVWELSRFLFCKKTREEQFDPSYHVLLGDYLETRKEEYQTPWAKRWLFFCFSVRTLGLLVQCASTSWRVAIVGALVVYGPRWLKDLLRDVFQDQ